MALRREEFFPVLQRHEYAQVEGYCWPATLAASLDSNVGNNKQTDIFDLGLELRTTQKFGNSNRSSAELLAKRGIGWYAEANCSTERLTRMLIELPIETDFFTIVFDWRPRPGYNYTRDREEPHLVSPRAVLEGRYGKNIQYYDPDSIIGGILTCPVELWPEWHHEGPESREGRNRVLELCHLDQPSVGFVMLAGIDKEKVHKIVGEPK